MVAQERIVFIPGNNVNLRLLNKDDAGKIVHWLNDPEIIKFLGRYMPITLDQEIEHLDKLYRDDRKLVLGIETKDGELIGVMGLHGIDYVSRVATTGSFIGERRLWGKGLGTEAKMLFLNYAFNALNLRKICSEVWSFNGRSINYSKKCGYQEEGKQCRHHFHNGVYWDIVLLAVFREDWLPLWEEFKREHNL